MKDKQQEGEQWLSPSAALNRFDLPQGSVVDIAHQEEQRVRYGFRIGDLGLLIGADTVSEVLEKTPIFPIPRTPAWLSGLLNLRGNLVPVFDLKLFLQLQHESNQKRHVLVLDRGDTSVATLIEGLPQAVAATRKLSRLPPLPWALQAHTSLAYVNKDAVWLEFDHLGFFQSIGNQLAKTN
jgi:chemotaxis signal transduction protein